MFLSMLCKPPILIDDQGHSFVFARTCKHRESAHLAAFNAFAHDRCEHLHSSHIGCNCDLGNALITVTRATRKLYSLSSA